MFDVGFAELFLLSVIGLLILGPERLPAVARTLGGFVRKARSSWYTLKRSIETELAEADVTRPVKAARKEMDELSQQISEFGQPSLLPENAGDEPKENAGTPEERDPDSQ